MSRAAPVDDDFEFALQTEHDLVTGMQRNVGSLASTTVPWNSSNEDSRRSSSIPTVHHPHGVPALDGSCGGFPEVPQEVIVHVAFCALVRRRGSPRPRR
jgi:hypothetical protein